MTRAFFSFWGAPSFHFRARLAFMVLFVTPFSGLFTVLGIFKGREPPLKPCILYQKERNMTKPG
jgi:hypothetical protein